MGGKCLVSLVTVSLALVSVACASQEGASGTDPASTESLAETSPSGVASPSPRPTPEPATLRGKLASLFVMTRGDCEDAELLAVTGNVEQQFVALMAEDAIKSVEGKTIQIRDSQGEVVATPTTSNNAVVERFQRRGSLDRCVAYTSFSAVLPARDSYVFSIDGLSGAPKPVTYSDLEFEGFNCDLIVLEEKVQRYGCSDLSNIGID